MCTFANKSETWSLAWRSLFLSEVSCLWADAASRRAATKSFLQFCHKTCKPVALSCASQTSRSKIDVSWKKTFKVQTDVDLNLALCVKNVSKAYVLFASMIHMLVLNLESYCRTIFSWMGFRIVNHEPWLKYLIGCWRAYYDSIM